jgi:predicted alpha/beta hydrolase
MLGGTAIPRRFYAPFATHLAARGFVTLTLDFRGVGDSRPVSLRGFEATKQDWARLDFSAGFGWLEEHTPDVPHYVVGHSVGGQLLALMTAPEAIDGVVTFASGFGYWANMTSPYKWFVASLWYVGIPLGTAISGYMPAKRFGLGEDIPTGVAREWARWGRRADYFTSELASEPGFAALRAPWLALYTSDDDIATPKNAGSFLALYPNAEKEVRTLHPREYGFDQIGHLGFFSRDRQILWNHASDWLIERSAR